VGELGTASSVSTFNFLMGTALTPIELVFELRPTKSVDWAACKGVTAVGSSVAISPLRTSGNPVAGVIFEGRGSFVSEVPKSADESFAEENKEANGELPEPHPLETSTPGVANGSFEPGVDVLATGAEMVTGAVEQLADQRSQHRENLRLMRVCLWSVRLAAIVLAPRFRLKAATRQVPDSAGTRR
jgi:hypothetical protein